MKTYNVVKSFKVENQVGTSDTAKVLLLKSLQIKFGRGPRNDIDNIEYGFEIFTE